MRLLIALYYSFLAFWMPKDTLRQAQRAIRRVEAENDKFRRKYGTF